MSRINILGIDTRGVDMKSSPLLLGNRRLRSATNVVFEENVVRTRPGFKYVSLTAQGQFQGGAVFRPHEGISAATTDGHQVQDAGLSEQGIPCKREIEYFDPSETKTVERQPVPHSRDTDCHEVLISDIPGLAGALASGVSQEELESGLASKADVNHTHVRAEIDDLNQMWVNLKNDWTEAPTLHPDTPVLGGQVWIYTYGTTIYYLHVPDPYNSTEDTFYETYQGGVLSDPIETRGKAI